MRGKLISLSLVLVVAGPLALFSAPKKPTPIELNLMDLEGKKVHLKDYHGKVVVINFWATWCGPCKAEMPMFVEVEKKWATKGVVFLAASLDDKKSQKDIPAFVKKYQIDFPVWVGASGDDVDKFGLGGAVPDTAFVNEEGLIQFRIEGEVKRPELEERLEWITGDRKGTAPKALLHNLPPA